MANDEIVDRLFTKKKAAGKKNSKRGRLEEIIAEVKKMNNLTEDVVVNKALVRVRVVLIRKRCEQNMFVGNGYPGKSSPLALIKPYIFGMLIVLSKMRESPSPSHCVHLINYLIEGTEVKKSLIA